jgi:hypothetical protein
LLFGDVLLERDALEPAQAAGCESSAAADAASDSRFASMASSDDAASVVSIASRRTSARSEESL